MHEFEVSQRGESKVLPVMAVNKAAARQAAQQAGITDPVIRLKASTVGAWATFNVPAGLLSVVASDSILAYLREYGFREDRRESGDMFPSGDYSRAVAEWTPLREDVLAEDVGLFVQLFDGYDEIPGITSESYFGQLAARVIADRQGLTGRQVWRSQQTALTALRSWRNRATKQKESSAIARWIKFYSYREKYFGAILKALDDAHLAAVRNLNTGDAVLFITPDAPTGRWYPVLRVNEKSVRVRGDDESTFSIPFDKITQTRKKSDALSSSRPSLTGDFVFHRNMWFEVVGESPERLTLRSKRGNERHVLRTAISATRSRDEHLQLVNSNPDNLRRINPV